MRVVSAALIPGSSLMLTAEDLFWADTLLHGYPFLGGFCLSSPLSRFGYGTVLRMGRGHWLQSCCQWGGFFAPFPAVSSSWDCASSWIRRLLLQVRVRVTLPPNTPFHPGHLPAVGWAYIFFDVSIDFIAIFFELRTTLLLSGSRRRYIGRCCEVLYTHRHGLFWDGGLRGPFGSF